MLSLLSSFTWQVQDVPLRGTDTAATPARDLKRRDEGSPGLADIILVGTGVLLMSVNLSSAIIGSDLDPASKDQSLANDCSALRNQPRLRSSSSALLRDPMRPIGASKAQRTIDDGLVTSRMLSRHQNETADIPGLSTRNTGQPSFVRSRKRALPYPAFRPRATSRTGWPPGAAGRQVRPLRFLNQQIKRSGPAFANL